MHVRHPFSVSPQARTNHIIDAERAIEVRQSSINITALLECVSAIASDTCATAIESCMATASG
jgi:hypothetical protein